MGKAGKADICDCLVNKRAMKGFGSVQIGTKRQRNGRVQSYRFVAFSNLSISAITTFPTFNASKSQAKKASGKPYIPRRSPQKRQQFCDIKHNNFGIFRAHADCV